MSTAILLLAACLQAPAATPPTEAVPAVTPIPLAPGRLELGIPGSPRGLAMADLDADGRDELLVVTLNPGVLYAFDDLERELAPLATPLELPFESYGLGPAVLPSGRVALGLRSSEALVVADLDLPADKVRGYERLELGAMPRVLEPGLGERLLVATDDDELLEIATTGVPEVVGRHALVDTLATAVAPVEGGVAVASQGSNSLVLYRYGDDGALVPGAHLELEGVPRSLLTVDLDGDGDDELVGVFGDNRAIALGFGARDGLGAWLADEGAPEPHIWPCGDLPLDLAAADLDRDGREEVLAVFMADLIVIVLDEFTDAGPLATNPVQAGANPWACAVGDLDGDGHGDVAVSNPSSGAVSVFFGQDAGAPGAPLGGLTSAPNWEATQAPHSMASGDLDGDGLDDLCLLSALEDHAVLLFGEADGLSAPVEVAIPAEADEVVAAELDGRPGKELVMVHQVADGSQLAVLRRGEGRAFVGASTAGRPPLAVRAEGLLAIDLDGDGLDELLVADTAGRALVALSLELTDAGPVPTELLRLEVEGSPGPMAAVRAPAGHGDRAGEPGGELLGIAVGQTMPVGGSLSLVLVEPGGGLRLVGNLAVPLPPEDVTACDLNADGNPDLVALCRPANDNAPGVLHSFLAPSSQTGGWTNLAPMQVGPKPFAVASADLNGDGAAELFASSQYAYRVDAFVGNPTTGQPRLTWRLGAHRGCMDLALLDVDGDGRDELAVSNNHSADVSLLRFPVDADE